MKKIAISTLSAALIVMLPGCASGPSYTIEKGWVKKGVSYDQAKRLLYACKEKARANAERETQIGGLTESCMTLEGYTWGEYRKRIY